VDIQMRHVRGAAIFLAMVTALAGCTAANLSPSPGAPNSSSSPAASPLASLDSHSPAASPASTDPLVPASTPVTPTYPPVPTDSPAPVDATPTPNPTAPLGPLPSVAPVPDGTWTSIKWIAIPRGHAPAVKPAADFETNATLDGWSHGYVEFVWDPAKVTVVPWVSADGLTWKSGTKLDISGWAAVIKQQNAKFDGPINCRFWQTGFEEGPATLLLRGSIACDIGCASPSWFSPEKMWTSTDGFAWTPIDIAATFGKNGAGAISGGSSGFVSLDWSSTDGRTWRKNGRPAEASTKGTTLGSPVAIAGGFIIPGTVLVHAGSATPACAYTFDPGKDPPTYRAGMWWSADGTTWTRETLPGTTAEPLVQVTLSRLNDTTVLATQTTYTADFSTTGPVAAWISHDGKTWTLLPSGMVATLTSCQVLEGRNVGLLYTTFYDDQFNDVYRLMAMDGNQSRVLPQTGDVPTPGTWQMALGPTGLLVTLDGSRAWLGVPTFR
jgi:hypothetical protein